MLMLVAHTEVAAEGCHVSPHIPRKRERLLDSCCPAMALLYLHFLGAQNLIHLEQLSKHLTVNIFCLPSPPSLTQISFPVRQKGACSVCGVALHQLGLPLQSIPTWAAAWGSMSLGYFCSKAQPDQSKIAKRSGVVGVKVIFISSTHPSDLSELLKCYRSS